MGRSKKNERLRAFVPLFHHIMRTPAWIALSVYSKALYPEVKRRAGVMGSKNGAFSLSVREASEYLGCDKNTASKAFDDLQAKGFVVPVQIGYLGVEGVGKATIWRVTELGIPGKSPPSNDFNRWKPDEQHPVQKGKRNHQK